MILPSAIRRFKVAYCLDQLKDLGFHWATRSGVTVSIGDVEHPSGQAEDPGEL